MKLWKVRIAGEAQKQLVAIEDTRIRESIVKRIDRLQQEPEKQGKPLSDELGGYRSVRAAGQRYRIIFKTENDLILVTVVALGIRKDGDKKDAYALAKKLARLDLLDEKGQF